MANLFLIGADRDGFRILQNEIFSNLMCLPERSGEVTKIQPCGRYGEVTENATLRGVGSGEIRIGSVTTSMDYITGSSELRMYFRRAPGSASLLLMLRQAILAAFIAAFVSAAGTQLIGQSPPDMVQLAPGVSVPSKSSGWAVSASPTCAPVQLYRSPIKVNRHWAKNLAAGSSAPGFFIYRPTMTIEFDGARAKTRLMMQAPVFYVRQADTLEGEGDLRPRTTNDSVVSELQLVRLKSSKEKRVEESISTNGFGRNAKRRLNQLSITRDKLNNGWLRLSPVEPLEPGEYAIVALPRSAALFSEYAYDFGIDPVKPSRDGQ